MASVSVQISADVTALTAKLAVAKAEYQDSTAELRKMAQEMRAAGAAASDELKAGLTSAAQAAAQSRAEVSKLNAEMHEASGGAGVFKEGLDLAREAAGAFGIALGVSEIVSFGKELIANGAEIEHQAQVLNLSTDALQAYRAAARESDVDVSTLDTSLRRFIKSVGEAENGSKAQVEAFDALGITAADLASGSESLLPKVAEALLRIYDAAERARLETVLFGRSGQELEGVLQKLADPELAERMRTAGFVADKETLENLAGMRRWWGDFYDWFAVNSEWYIGTLGRMGEDAKKAFGAGAGVPQRTSGIPLANAPPPPTASGAGHQLTLDDVLDIKTRIELINKGIAESFAEWNKNLTETAALTKKIGEGEMAVTEKVKEILHKDMEDRIRGAHELVDIDIANRLSPEAIKKQKETEFSLFKATIEREREEAKGSFDEQLRLDQELVAKAKALYGEDSVNYQQALRQKAADLKAQIDSQLAPWKKLTDGIGSAFDSMLKGVLQGTQSLQQVMARLAQNMLLAFANMAIKSAETWAINRIKEVLITQQTEAQKTAAVAAGEAATTGIRSAAAIEGKAVQAAAGSASVVADAYKAGAGAYSAVVGIPYIGPFIAPVAAAVAFAGVMAFDVFSAEGGMDIGPGVNPMTQLHAREMVLPANLADAVRGMAAGSGGGPQVSIPLSVTAMDSRSVIQALSDRSVIRELGRRMAAHWDANPGDRPAFAS